MANKNLNAAKVAKKDEFYTQLSDIERELQHYWQHFHGKVVLCNCDDPYESNFFKYFALRFNQLGLKKLICTCYDGSPVQGTELIFRFDGEGNKVPKKVAYKVEITEVKDENGDGAVDLSDVRYLLQNDKNVLSVLQTGDFRSAECVELLKEADIPDFVNASPTRNSLTHKPQRERDILKTSRIGYGGAILFISQRVTQTKIITSDYQIVTFAL